jgi:hypothetical protein
LQEICSRRAGQILLCGFNRERSASSAVFTNRTLDNTEENEYFSQAAIKNFLVQSGKSEIGLQNKKAGLDNLYQA